MWETENLSVPLDKNSQEINYNLLFKILILVHV